MFKSIKRLFKKPTTELKVDGTWIDSKEYKSGKVAEVSGVHKPFVDVAMNSYTAILLLKNIKQMEHLYFITNVLIVAKINIIILLSLLD